MPIDPSVMLTNLTLFLAIRWSILTAFGGNRVLEQLHGEQRLASELLTKHGIWQTSGPRIIPTKIGHEDSYMVIRQIRFDAHDGPICPACKRQMLINRRSPHPLYGNTYELQTFECRTCPNEIERSADRAGFPHVSVAPPCVDVPL
jgi:hypothetical protein